MNENVLACVKITCMAVLGLKIISKKVYFPDTKHAVLFL